MKNILPILLLLGVLFGCGVRLPFAATPLPTQTAVSLAQPTSMPSPIAQPSGTALPSATRTLAATVIATKIPPPPSSIPTQIPKAAQTSARQAPTILEHFKLLDLPGEGRAPSAIALLEDKVYVANSATANIAMLDAERVQSFISLPANPTALVADTTNNRLFASTYEPSTLLSIENNRVANQSAMNGRVNALALDGDNLYVAFDNDALIERYDAKTLTKRAALKLSQGFGVSDIVVDAARNRLYAAVYGKIIAIALDSFTELFTLGAPYLYSDFAVNPNDGSIWSGAYDEKSSRAFVVGYSSEGQELARLFIGSDLQATTFDNANRLYVLDRFNNQVYVIQTPQAQLVTTVRVNQAPSDAVFDARRNLLFVTNQEDDNVSAIDGAKLQALHSIPLASQITALASNPSRKRVYAANASNNTLYAIEGTRVVGQVATGFSPVDIALDPPNNRIYVASRADGKLTLIDEAKLEIVASEFITRALSTTAMDSPNQKLFAGSYLLNPKSMQPEKTFFAQGLTLNSQTAPLFQRANPVLKKLYAIASNGVPGSNSRFTLFRFLYDNLTESKMLGSSNGGNTTAFAIDPFTNNLFAASTHPLAYTHALDVFDANDNRTQSVALASNTTSVVVNPETHHVFLAHAFTPENSTSKVPLRDNTVEILDTRTLGHVVTLDVPNEPYRMALLQDAIYVASYNDGTITLIGDAVTTQPPAPTPTLTPSPFPTWTWTPSPRVTATQAVTVTPTALVLACDFEIAAELGAALENSARAKLGCPTDNSVTSEAFALQQLSSGLMVDDFRDETKKQVTVLFPNKTFRVVPDTWREGDAEEPCPDVFVRAGLQRPRRGFGSVWCAEPDVQALGGGLFAEQSIKVVEQKFEKGRVWYMPNVGMFVLLDEGTWQ